MSQESSSKQSSLLHPIENNRTNNSSPKNKHLPLNSTQTIGINTEHIQVNRNVGTNTPNYAEQMAKAVEKGQTPENIVQMLMQSTMICTIEREREKIFDLDDASEDYWKSVTQRRQRAIEETITENQQVENRCQYFLYTVFFSYIISSMN